ncbi:MAG: glycosyltransferase family 2 protein [bacterium]|nr:glycosyltransferase family 2 protein [bacterium]
MSPTISIIIPCFNYGKFLPDAVESVLAQTYESWECLIIDDGSKDDTAAVAKELEAKDPRIKYVFKENGGLSSARNYGIKLAKGNYICFLDADDELDKNKLNTQLVCFDRHPGADIVYGRAMFFEKNDRSVLYHNKSKTNNTIQSTFSGQGKELLNELLKDNITVVSAPLIRANVFSRAGNFDESYRAYEDWHYWIKCALANVSFQFCDLPPVCTYIRFGHESMMSNTKKMTRSALQLRKFLMPHLPLGSKMYNSVRMLRSYIKLLLHS